MRLTNQINTLYCFKTQLNHLSIKRQHRVKIANSKTSTFKPTQRRNNTVYHETHIYKILSGILVQKRTWETSMCIMAGSTQGQVSLLSLAVPFFCSILANPPDVYPSNSFASLTASLLSAEVRVNTCHHCHAVFTCLSIPKTLITHLWHCSQSSNSLSYSCPFLSCIHHSLKHMISIRRSSSCLSGTRCFSYPLCNNIYKCRQSSQMKECHEVREINK